MEWKYIITRGLVLLLLMMTWVVTHESVHYVIFQYYQCEDISFGMTKFYFYTTADPAECVNIEFMMLAHCINEIIGYCIMPFMLVNTFINWDRLMTED